MMNSALSSPLSLLSSETRRGLIANLQERLTNREAQRRAVEDCKFSKSVSCPFKLLHTRLLSRPARHYPRFRIRRSSSERRGDFNPPDSRAAQHTLRTHPSPSRLRSISRLSRLYDRPCSGDFAPGRGGFLQLLGMSLSPCCRFHPAEVKEPHRSDFGSPMQPSPSG